MVGKGVVASVDVPKAIMHLGPEWNSQTFSCDGTCGKDNSWTAS